MNTIKIYLAESGRVADLRKDFPLYQYQFQNKLLNIYVPTSIMAPSFSSQSADGTPLADYVASTAVKIGMSYTARDGSIKKSKNYYVRFLKTLTYQNVEYALYERKLPKEFTLYAGQGANAPILTANVVNIQQETENGTPIVLSVITSQMCSLDVMASTNLDIDEAVEPTEIENINAQLNEINDLLPQKQDKIDDMLETSNKTVVGAINENKRRIDVNAQNISTNQQNISKNRNDIDYLIENSQMTEEYIGRLEGNVLPTNYQLTEFVRNNTNPTREPKNGDVIIFVLEVEEGTDKNYKYFFTAMGWQGYEIPPLEEASNGTLGILEGTYGLGTNADTLVDISGGRILNIFIREENGTYRNIKEYITTNAKDITDIVNGDTVVGEAMRALEDGLGNNIVNTYLTQTLGATKQFVKDYAMPREFNDVYFISSNGYQNTVPTTPESGVQFTLGTNEVGDFQIFQIEKDNNADFELSSKNGYSNNIYVSATENIRVTFRLTTQYKKAGQDWADLSVELTSPINFTAGDIEKISFASPFTSLENNVITLTSGDKIRQTLDVITQESYATLFEVYSNDIYPSTFNLTSQSYVLSGIEQAVSRTIALGVDGVIEADKVIFTVQDADSFVEFRTNQREFLINGLLPLVGELDDTLPVYIEFGDTVYGVFSYMKGYSTPITIGDLKSTMVYSETTGYSFTTKMIFLETSTYKGFALIQNSITAQQLANIISDTETVVVSLDESGTKLELQLSAETLNKLMKALVTPMNAPSGVEIVAVDETNSQVMLTLGEGLYVADGQLKITGGGSSAGTTNYQDLDNKPILNSNNSTSQTPSSNEVLNGTINLHKVSKTGALADTIEDSQHRTVTDTEKANWNDTDFSKLTNVPKASTGVEGLIEIATDQEAETGTNETKAVNPKQLLTAIQGLGSVFTLKGSKPTVNDLPATGNNIGDVWYVIDESVGYIWLNDGTVDKWEQLGLPIDLSSYVQFSDIINNLTSTASDKPLSALQGKQLNDMLSSLMQEVVEAQADISDNAQNISNLEAEDETNKGNIAGNSNKISQLSNPNLLLNSNFELNTRGLESYDTANDYTVDRWLNRENSLEVIPQTNGGVKLIRTENAVSSVPMISQSIKGFKDLLGKTVTLSMKVDIDLTNGGYWFGLFGGNEERYASTEYGGSGGHINGTGIKSFTFKLPSTVSYSNLNAVIRLNQTNATGEFILVDWIKLEVGTLPTAYSPNPIELEEYLCKPLNVVKGGEPTRITNINFPYTVGSRKTARFDIASRSSITANDPATDGFLMTFFWDTAYEQIAQLAIGGSGQQMQIRGNNQGTWSSWKTFATTDQVTKLGTNTSLYYGNPSNGTVVTIPTMANYRYIWFLCKNEKGEWFSQIWLRSVISSSPNIPILLNGSTATTQRYILLTCNSNTQVTFGAKENVSNVQIYGVY